MLNTCNNKYLRRCQFIIAFALMTYLAYKCWGINILTITTSTINMMEVALRKLDDFRYTNKSIPYI